MDLLHGLLDQGLLDSRGDRCGRVDDVVVEDVFDRPPRVMALVSGPGAKSRLLGERAHRVSVWLHRLLGVPPPIEPAEIPWDCVRHLNAHVVLSVPASDLGLDRLNAAVAERIIGRIPGAKK